MAKDNKVRMPSSMAGITQYFEEGGSRINLSPKAVIALIIICSLLIIALHTFAPATPVA